MKTRVDFSSGGVQSNIISMAFPMLIAQLFNVLYSIVDRIYLGNMPDAGESALGGIGVCVPIITIITGFSNLFGLGGAPIYSIARGRGDDKEAEKVMHNAFMMLIVSGVIIGVLGVIFMKPLLYMLGATDVIYPYAASYLRIYLYGTCFSMISLGMNPYINSQGFAGTGMVTVVSGACVNFILDPIFIFVFDMGIKGAAMATVISQIISATWVLSFLGGKKPEHRLKLKGLSPDYDCIKRIMKLGTASFVMSCTDSMTQIVCNRVLLIYGGEIYIGIMTILNSVRQLVLTPVSAITDGASSVISYNYGARKISEVRKSIKFMTKLAAVYSVILCGFILLFPKIFMSLFTNDAEMLGIGSTAMRIYFSVFFMMAFQYSGQSVFKSLNKAGHAIFFSLFRKVILVVPLTLLLPDFIGVTGVFYAETASNVLGGGICYLTMLILVNKLGKNFGKEKNVAVST